MLLLLLLPLLLLLHCLLWAVCLCKDWSKLTHDPAALKQLLLLLPLLTVDAPRTHLVICRHMSLLWPPVWVLHLLYE
jgi:hypothetical protein